MSLAQLLDASLVAELEAWCLRTRLKGRGLLEGLHHTQRWGHAATFAGHREYSPGDDLRRLDWRASARSGRWQIKRFERETELTAHLVIDASGSMGFAGAVTGGGGGRTKLDYAKRVAAALAYLLVASRDRVGLVRALPAFARASAQVSGAPPTGPMTTATLERLPSRTGPSHLTKVASSLLQLSPAGESDLTATMTALGLQLSRRSLLVVLSDFFVDVAPLIDVLALLRSQGHEVLLLHVVDDAELSFPFTGDVRFRSLETEEVLDIDADDVRGYYMEKLGALLAALEEGAKAHRLRYARLPTSRPLAAALGTVLEGLG